VNVILHHGLPDALPPDLQAALRLCGIEPERVRNQIFARRLQRAATTYFAVAWQHLVRGRTRELSRMRFVCMWGLREHGLGWQEIATAFGMTNHTSAIHGVESVIRDAALLDQAGQVLALARAREATVKGSDEREGAG